MSLTSSLQRIVQAKADIKSAIEAKGVTVGNDVSIVNYDDYIAQITGGGSATLTTKTITSNGTYYASSDNADGYSSVTVNVSGGGSSDVPFSSPRYIEIPTGELYDCYTVGHYIIGKPNRYQSSYSYTVGSKFAIYDIDTQQVIHTYTTDQTYPDSYVLNYAEGKYLIIINQWGSTQKPYAIWWYNENTDTFTYVEDQDDIPTELIYCCIRYVSVLYKGQDFGIIKTNSGGQYQILLIKPDVSLEAICNDAGDLQITTTYDNDYYYIGGKYWAYETYQTYKVVRMQKNNEGYYYDTLSYNMGTSTSYKRCIYQCGRFMCALGYSSNRAGYIVDMVTGQSIATLTSAAYNGNVLMDADTQRVVAFASSRTLIFDGSAYLNNTTPYYIYDTSTSYQVQTCRVINHRFFVGTYTDLREAVFGTGLVQVINMDGYTGIGKCIKDTDMLVYYTSTGTNKVIYVYDTITSTYTNIQTDTTTVASFNIKGVNDNTSMFTTINSTHCPNWYYLGSNNSSGYIYYNATSETYLYIRGGGTGKVLDTDTFVTSGFYQDDTNRSVFVLTAGGTSIKYQPNTSTTTAITFTYGYKYNNKVYFESYISSPLAVDMLCYDITNGTISLKFTETTNIYNSYFNYYYFNASFGTSYEIYQPIEQGNKVCFAYIQSGINGKSYDVAQQTNSSGKGLVFDKSTESWTVIDGAYTISTQNYNENIIVYANSSNAVSFYNLTTGVATSTGITACNTGAFKCMSDGCILIKQTTNLVSYSISLGTSTTLKSATNNSNSNSYGSIRGFGNFCYTMFYNACGYYLSSTSTWTAMNNISMWYSSSGTQYMEFHKLNSTRYCLSYRDSTNLYIFAGTFDSPVTSSNSYVYGVIYYDTDKYIIYEANNSPRRDNIYIYNYDGTSSVTHHVPRPTVNSVGTMSEYNTINGKPFLLNVASEGFYDIENDEWFVFPTFNQSTNPIWLNINTLGAEYSVFALRKHYTFTSHLGAKQQSINFFTNKYVVVDTSPTVTKVVWLGSPTQDELA